MKDMFTWENEEINFDEVNKDLVENYENVNYKERYEENTNRALPENWEANPDLDYLVEEKTEVGYPLLIIENYSKNIISLMGDEFTYKEGLPGIKTDFYFKPPESSKAVFIGVHLFNYYNYRRLRNLGVSNVEFYYSKGNKVDLRNPQELLEKHPEFFNPERYQ